MLVPNVKVRFLNAFIAGVFAGTGFMILQWIFVTGQMYVAKYNAIFGSLSFIPLMLIWLQLVWVITLSGAVLCYSSQNIFEFDFKDDVERMAVAAIIVRRFAALQPPLTLNDIIVDYHLPARLVSGSIDALLEAGVIVRVVIDGKKEIFGYQPAVDIDSLTVSSVRDRIEAAGRHGFIPAFEKMFPGVVRVYDELATQIDNYAGHIRLADIEVQTPQQTLCSRL